MPIPVFHRTTAINTPPSDPQDGRQLRHPQRGDGYPRSWSGPPNGRVGGVQPEAFDDGRVGHAAALAHRLQTVAAAGALELVEQRGHQASAGAAERMAERDRAAVDVDLAHVGVQLLLPREHDRGERLVDLDQVDVVDGQAGLARAPCWVAGIGAVSIRRGSAPARAKLDEPRPRASARAARAFSSLMISMRRRAVGDLRRVAGGDPPTLLLGAERRLQLGRATRCVVSRRPSSTVIGLAVGAAAPGRISRSKRPSSVARRGAAAASARRTRPCRRG